MKDNELKLHRGVHDDLHALRLEQPAALEWLAGTADRVPLRDQPVGRRIA